MKDKKNAIELILEGAELTEDAKKSIVDQIEAIVQEKTDKNLAFLVEQKLKDAKINIYKAVKARAKAAFMEALEMVKAETKTDAIAYKKDLTDKLSDYLDSTIGNMVPESLVKEAAASKHYKAIVEKMKGVLVIDEVTRSREVREAVDEANSILQKLKANNNKLMKEKIRLHKKCKDAEAELHLEKKMKGLTDSQRAFVAEALKGKEAPDMDELFESTLKLMRENGRKAAPAAKPATKTVTDPKVISENHKKAVVRDAGNKDPESIDLEEMDYFIEAAGQSND